MSWQASAWAKRVKTGSPAAKAVLLCLADYADEEHSCFPGQERLAAETEQSVRTVRRHLADLEALGIISRSKRYADSGHRTSDRYVIAVEDPSVVMIDLPANLSGGLPDKVTAGQIDLRSTETPDQPTTGQPAQSLPDTGDRVTTSRTTSPTPENNQASTRGSRLPEDWWPDDALKQWLRDQEWARAPGFNAQIETEKFKDYWKARSGAGGVKLDWPATWRNWMRSAAQRLSGRPAPQVQHDDALAESHAAMFKGA